MIKFLQNFSYLIYSKLNFFISIIIFKSLNIKKIEDLSKIYHNDCDKLIKFISLSTTYYFKLFCFCYLLITNIIIIPILPNVVN